MKLSGNMKHYRATKMLNFQLQPHFRFYDTSIFKLKKNDFVHAFFKNA